MLTTLKDFKPKRSLRTLLTVLFILFSVVPIGFLTFFSLFKFEGAISNEIQQRLIGNGREIENTFIELSRQFEIQARKHEQDVQLQTYLAVVDLNNLRALVASWLITDQGSGISVYNKQGRLLLSLEHNENRDVLDLTPKGNFQTFLSEEDLSRFKNGTDYQLLDFSRPPKLNLLYLSPLKNRQGQIYGYLEQRAFIDESFLRALRNRLNLEIFVLRAQGQVAVSIYPELYKQSEKSMTHFLTPTPSSLNELEIRSSPLGFISYPMSWGPSRIHWVLGASKKDADKILQAVNFAFVGVVSVTLILLVITIVWATKKIVKPLQDLVVAADTMLLGEKAIEIPVTSDTEIGLLAYSFNELSRQVNNAQKDLKGKISELEKANSELKEAQTRLVHSSKMVSLGQLVAGVAHELNNPIAFIYSNMTPLRDYSIKLLDLVDTAEKAPEQLSEKKKHYDLDYIKSDLPKLLSSCEDGARRTRDIVVGLRNFSRLEEAQLKEIDLADAIEATLEIIKGELKNRITIHRQYTSILKVECLASQINQVIMNILTNAAQAIAGTGEIWISTALEEKSNEQFAKLVIQDSGHGMDSQTLEKIFDPFFSTKGVGQGTGLGLSISYGIIESHGGEIRVRSEIGVGTEFTVLIPISGKRLKG